MKDLLAVDVPLAGRAYRIHIASGLLDHVGGLLRACSPVRRATIVTDTHVAPLYSDRLAASLEAANVVVEILAVPAGEPSKSSPILGEIYDSLAELGHGRDDPIIALGGGMIGDLAGFAAATWHRGVPFIQCPTTLEAAVDAGIGGKTGINHPSGKNLIGAFHQPLFVAIDPDCLRTLQDRDYRAALAESVKHAVLAGDKFLAWHEAAAAGIRNRDASIAAELIRRNCEFKAGVVAADEREAAGGAVGRAALNFGHTIGHALEAFGGYALRHGEAVAWGIVAEMELAVRMDRMADEARRRVERLLSVFGLPPRPIPALDRSALSNLIRADKKTLAGRVRFVLPDCLGHAAWAEPTTEQVGSALNYLLAY